MAKHNNFDPYSYKQILHDRQAFRQSGGTRSDDFNMADTPGLQFYRILFHFYSQESDDMLSGYGLLHPTWEVPSIKKRGRVEDLWQYSTAWSYLKQNGEDERANYLKNFICLLSNINTFSPWYWKGIKGLDSLISKKQAAGDFKFGERNKIVLECLPDAVDNRIRTLIDLYRASVWSWRTKREIVPSNLRKFDMTICLMQAPIRGIHTPANGGLQMSDFLGAANKWLNTESNDFASSNPVGANENVKHISTYKIFELHGCEIDYTVGSEAYSSLESAEGFKPEYNIPILVDDIVEYSYNEFAPQIGEFGDMVALDANEYTYKSDASPLSSSWNNTDTARLGRDVSKDVKKSKIENRLNNAQQGSKRAIKLERQKAELESEGDKGFEFPEDDNSLSNRIDASTHSTISGQLLSFLSSKTSNKISKVVLGNLFGFSINRTAQAVGDLLHGNVSNAISRVKNTSKNYSGLDDQNPDKKISGLNPGDQGSIISKERTIQLGNLFEGNTIKNNL
jgi:hypothetical protein